MNIKHYTVYKTINLSTRQYYIGTHITENPHDDYLGSGTWIMRSISKYGKDNFIKEILFDLTTEIEMFEKEAELVTDRVLDDPLCYNLIVGGRGGFSYINKNNLPKFHGHNHDKSSMVKMVNTKRKRGNLLLSASARQNIAVAQRIRFNTDEGKAHLKKMHALAKLPKTEEHKQHISEALAGSVQEVVTCPHCDKEGGIRAMHRWHFDNCKNLKCG